MVRRRILLTALALVLAFTAASGLDRPPATAQVAPSVFDVHELARLHGDPPGTDFARLRVPSLGINAPVGAHHLNGDEPELPSPYGPADIAWYDLSAWHRLGGAPGAGGNAIFSGHVDYHANVPYAGIRYRGPAVFAELPKLRQGDLVEIDYQGQTLRYAVTWQRQLAADHADWGEIFSADVPVDSVTLFTCGGDFDPTTKRYDDRIVVRAERVLGEPNRLAMPEPGGFTWGTSGTNHVQALVASQRFDVAAVYVLDPDGDWRVYIPNSPAFANTLAGELRPNSFVILRRR
jgi:hypothetical protein